MDHSQLHAFPGESIVEPVAYFLEIASNCECLRGATNPEYSLRVRRWLSLAKTALEEVGATIYFNGNPASLYFGLIGHSEAEGEKRARRAYESLVPQMPEHIRLWTSATELSKHAGLFSNPPANLGTERMEWVFNNTKFQCIAFDNQGPTARPCYLPWPDPTSTAPHEGTDHET